ncbi:hypothetical protein PC128_g10976 [Phytophthora cactorum]|nr:hypothetical protein PC128_g10976 [Phytophthora cactorum]
MAPPHSPVDQEIATAHYSPGEPAKDTLSTVFRGRYPQEQNQLRSPLPECRRRSQLWRAAGHDLPVPAELPEWVGYPGAFKCFYEILSDCAPLWISSPSVDGDIKSAKYTPEMHQLRHVHIPRRRWSCGIWAALNPRDPPSAIYAVFVVTSTAGTVALCLLVR